MKIIGFNLLGISVKRKENLTGKLEIKQNINIKEIVKEKIPISKNEILKLKFGFNVDYSGDFAKLELEGFVLLLPEKEELKKVLKSWKSKKLPDDLRIPIFNFIMSKCNIKALNLEDELALPLHIPMPRISAKDKEKSN